jgi:antitoxin YefM
METLTAAEAAQNLIQLMTLAHQDGRQYRITADEGSVVLLSEETYQNLIVTLELLSTPGLMKGLKLLDINSSSFSS